MKATHLNSYEASEEFIVQKFYNIHWQDTLVQNIG